MYNNDFKKIWSSKQISTRPNGIRNYWWLSFKHGWYTKLGSPIIKRCLANNDDLRMSHTEFETLIATCHPLVATGCYLLSFSWNCFLFLLPPDMLQVPWFSQDNQRSTSDQSEPSASSAVKRPVRNETKPVRCSVPCFLSAVLLGSTGRQKDGNGWWEKSRSVLCFSGSPQGSINSGTRKLMAFPAMLITWDGLVPPFTEIAF